MARHSGPRRVKLSEVLGKMSDTIKQEVSNTLMEGAQAIETDAKSNASSLFTSRSGRLLNGFCIRPLQKGMRVRIEVSAINPKDGVDYARILEFSPHKGHPFLYSAFHAHKDEIHEKIVAAVRKGLHT